MLRVALFMIAMGLLNASCGPAPITGNNAQEITPVKPVTNVFPEATEVRLFVETAIGADGKSVFSKPSGLKLSPKQRAEFESSLTVQPQPQESAACFIPHHFFRYSNAKGRVIGEIEVCFCCAGVAVSGNSNIPIGPDQELSADYGKLEAFVRSIGEPTQVQCGTAE